MQYPPDNLSAHKPKPLALSQGNIQLKHQSIRTDKLTRTDKNGGMPLNSPPLKALRLPANYPATFHNPHFPVFYKKSLPC
jgi:hypothetical protein